MLIMLIELIKVGKGSSLIVETAILCVLRAFFVSFVVSL
jgi:hypothetical protein